ncbi:hypothetical protein CVT26_010625 [Gymnopilus dilepis]|uniref:Uncharacterized protein n=1 Tax=Gymnopilus dilepis TaxID=231916 RepID=A0A409W542_9AGAR|nr:hypothetical protein CVT26_010625 [Gymnopilus dilepis]
MSTNEGIGEQFLLLTLPIDILIFFSAILDSPYHYVPTRYVTIIFLSLFGVSTALHTIQAIKYRMPWLILTASLCGVIELLGWAGRLWSSISPLLLKPFQIQFVNPNLFLSLGPDVQITELHAPLLRLHPYLLPTSSY